MGSLFLSASKMRKKLKTARKAEKNVEYREVLADVRAQIQNRAAGVFVPLSAAEINANARALLKVRRKKGEVKYQRRLKKLRAWAVGVVQRQAAEPDRGDVLRGIVRTVVPALVGGVVSTGLARIRGGGDLRGPIPATPGPRAAAVRAKIPYHLYAALARQGDPRAEQLRLRGLVAPPTAAPMAQPAFSPRPLQVRAPTFRPQRARVTSTPMWRGVQPGWFGGV